MKGWQNAILIIVSTFIVVFPMSTYAMSSDRNDNTSKYRVEYVTHESSKVNLSGEALREPNQEALIAIVKVDKGGYIPDGINIRTQISPTIFTADIPRNRLNALEHDPAIVSIEPAQKMRSY